MRALNRALAVLLALVLLVGGLLAVVEIVLAALDRPHLLVPHERWSAWLREQTFTTGVVRAVLVGLVVLGLLLLVAGLRRGRPGRVPLAARTDGVHVTASRRGLERALARAARRADGVTDARVRAGRRSVRVRAETALRAAEGLRPRIGAAVDQQLEELGLAGAVKTTISVSRKAAR
ncbi:DUF6286 domain-containing protein [Geodermatophilus nigrescens]